MEIQKSIGQRHEQSIGVVHNPCCCFYNNCDIASQFDICISFDSTNEVVPINTNCNDNNINNNDNNTNNRKLFAIFNNQP